jgi:hypothetical protein
MLRLTEFCTVLLLQATTTVSTKHYYAPQKSIIKKPYFLLWYVGIGSLGEALKPDMKKTTAQIDPCWVQGSRRCQAWINTGCCRRTHVARVGRPASANTIQSWVGHKKVAIYSERKLHMK